MRTIHVIIDPQNDFIDDVKNNPSLPVNGALKNMEVLSDVLKKDKIDEVLITLDTHNEWDIAHTAWWRDSDGNNIEPFTAITSNDIISGKYKCADESLKEYSLNYTLALESGGKHTHFIWPNHCIDGTIGHQVHSLVKNALEEISVKTSYLNKGMNPKTEHYSAFRAEVPVLDDDGTKLDSVSIKKINEFDNIVFSGEAQSHCVRASVLDFLNNISEEDRTKVILLKDCMSSVSGFEKDGERFLIEAQELGARVMLAEQYLTLKNSPKRKM